MKRLVLSLNFLFIPFLFFGQFPKKELRGVWIATVKNIDWPSDSNLPSEEKIKELKDLVNYLDESGFNSIFFQVRTESDAFYEKTTEPWSSYLTGTQGKAPKPFFDPLKILIEEAHKKGIEVHAWFNLNRGVFSNKTTISTNHIIRKHPEWFINFSGQKLYNFGLPQVREYLSNIMVDITKNYEVDGVHLDDYFYPYPKKGIEFPDYQTYIKYRKGKESLANWRRNNIDEIIKKISFDLKETSPKVKFGISPFGIWQHKKNDPMGSATQNGLQSYNDLFADTRSWLEKGWIDYLAPQIYWDTKHAVAPYELLAEWWTKNHFNRHIYIGMGIYHIEDNWNLAEVKKQMAIADNLENNFGKILFSSHILQNNYEKIGDYIKNEAFKDKALVPPMPWKDSIPPLAPENLRYAWTDNQLELNWDLSPKSEDSESPKFYVIYESIEDSGKQSEYKIVRVLNTNKYTFPKNYLSNGKSYFVTSLDFTDNESSPSNKVEIK